VGINVGIMQRRNALSKRAKGLTARKVDALAKPGRHGDGNGLYLEIKPSGTKSWVLLYTFAGRRREMGLGRYPDVALAAARRKALQQREVLASGSDPLTVRQKPSPPTFGECADKYIAAHSSSWKNAKHQAQWRMTLTHYAKLLRGKRVDEITVADVLDVLKPLWTKRPETAARLRGRIEAVLDAAKAEGLRQGENPATWRGNLKHLLPKQTKLTRGHYEAMPYAAVPRFITKLRARQSVDAFALEFIILTAARTGEVLGATWGEVDLQTSVWSVPAKRMKSARAHRVPLSRRAFEVLKFIKQLRASDAEDALIFPGARNGQLSEMATAMLLRRMGHGDITTHGFRSSFRDWAGEVSNFQREVVEAALAHTVGDATERAYRRGDALEKRRRLMEAWADYLEGAKTEAKARLKVA
jgi:integrase